MYHTDWTWASASATVHTMTAKLFHFSRSPPLPLSQSFCWIPFSKWIFNSYIIECNRILGEICSLFASFTPRSPSALHRHSHSLLRRGIRCFCIRHYRHAHTNTRARKHIVYAHEYLMWQSMMTTIAVRYCYAIGCESYMRVSHIY